MEQGNDNNNNNFIIPNDPPLVAIQPPTNAVASPPSILPSVAATNTASITTGNLPVLPPNPYYVDTPPNQDQALTSLPSWYPPPHNYWSNPPHLIPQTMYHHGGDPNYNPNAVFSSSFGKGKPTKKSGRGGGARPLPYSRNIQKNVPKNVPKTFLYINNEQKMAIINPPTFVRLADLDDETLLDITDQMLFDRQVFHTNTVDAKLKYIEILKKALDAIPSLKHTVPAASIPQTSKHPQTLQLVKSSSIVPPAPPSLPARAPISKRHLFSQRYQEDVERRQLAYFESTAQYHAEQAQLDASIDILWSQLQKTGLIAYLQGGEIYNGLELGIVSQTRSKIEQLRELRKARLQTRQNLEVPKTDAASSNPVTITLTTPSSQLPLPDYKASFSNLPVEILALIFEQLSAGTPYRKCNLLPAALVSRKWNALITPIIYRDVFIGEDIEEDVDVIQRAEKERARRIVEDEERRVRLRQKAKGKMKEDEKGGLLTPDPAASVNGETPVVGLMPGVIGGQLSSAVEMVTPRAVGGNLGADVEGDQIYADLEDGVKVKWARTLVLNPNYRQAARVGGEPLVTMKHNICLLTALLNPQLAKHVRIIEYRARSFHNFPSSEFSRIYRPNTSYGEELLDIRKRSVARMRELTKKIIRNLTKVESLRIQGGDPIIANTLLGVLKWSGQQMRMLRLEGICLDRVCLERGTMRKDGGKRYERMEEIHFEACWFYFRRSRRSDSRNRTESFHAKKYMRGGRKLWRFLDSAPGLKKLGFDGCEFPVEPILAAWAVPDKTGCEVILPTGLSIDGSKGRRLCFKKLETLILEVQKKARSHLPLQSDSVWDEAMTSPLMETFFKTHEATLKRLFYHGSLTTGLGPTGISSLASNAPKLLRVPPSIANTLTALVLCHNIKARDGYNKPKCLYPSHHQLAPSKAFSMTRLLELLHALKLLHSFTLNIGTGCTIDHVLTIASALSGRSMRAFKVKQVVCDGRRKNNVITAEDVVKLVEFLGVDLQSLEVIPARALGNGGSVDGQILHVGLIEDDESAGVFASYEFSAPLVLDLDQDVPQPMALAPNPPLPQGVFLGQMIDNATPFNQNQLTQMFNSYQPLGLPYGAAGLGVLSQRMGPKSGEIGFEFDHLLRILAPLRSLKSLILPYFYPPPHPISSLDLTTLEARLRLPHPINTTILESSLRRPPSNRAMPHQYQPQYHPTNPYSPPQHTMFEENPQPLSILQFLDEYESMFPAAPGPSLPQRRKQETLASIREKYPLAAEAHAVKEAYLCSMRRIGRGFCGTTSSFPEVSSRSRPIGPTEVEPIWPKLEEVGLFVFGTRTTSLIEIDKGGKGWSVGTEMDKMDGMKSWIQEMQKDNRRGGKGGRAVVGEVLYDA